MKSQVTSIEQSRRLLELGVPADKTSMVWHRMFQGRTTGFTEWTLKMGPIGKYTQSEVFQIFPAFTVADLLGMLPKKITTNGGAVHILHIGACSSTSPCWCLYWGDEETQVGWQERISFLHLLEDAIEWLLSNGYGSKG